ncbi:MAG: hypothetical protein M3Z02_06035 [Actinomycetota bacterium]|nr:hypothetical protein [Actinomycetota bacterium]
MSPAQPSTTPSQTPSPNGSRETVAGVVARLSDDDLDRGERGRLIGRLIPLLGGSARRAGLGAVTGGRWLADLLLELAPHLPVRNVHTLSEHHHGRTGDELAESLVQAASRASAAVGAAGGVLAAVEFAAPPALLSTPVQLAAETLAVVAIEVKLIAELHEVFGVAVPGSGSERAAAYVTAWANERGVDVLAPGNLSSALGTAARRELRRRLMRRVGRNVTTLAPFLAGAAAGAELNRRATRSLGDAVVRDLRGRR